MLKLRTLLLLFCAFALSACGNGEKEAAPPPALKVRLAPVSVIQSEEAAVFNATLAAKETVEVQAKVSGYLKEQLFNEGSLVQEGDLLYKLDDRELAAALESAKAETAKAEATWKNAEIVKERYVTLADKGAVSLQERDDKVTAAAEALAAHNACKAEEERAAVDLGYASIAASITGRINRSAVDVGAFVTAGNTLLTTIYNTDPIRAEFSITDREFSHFAKLIAERGGNTDALRFRLSLGDDHEPYEHEGVLEMADPVLDPKTNTMGVRALFPNPQDFLRPGMYANVTGVMGVRDVLTVPEAAVVDRAGGKAVFMVDGQGILAAVPVEIGALRDGRRIILNGLAPGQKVVIEGLVQAQPGMRAEVVDK
jgi:membrane fusion protein (multidrug efflux system)